MNQHQPRHQDGQRPRSLGLYDEVLHEQYVVISEAETPHKRICVRLIMDQDNANVTLLANSETCPQGDLHQQPQTTSRDQLTNGHLWTFNLTRISKCINIFLFTVTPFW